MKFTAIALLATAAFVAAQVDPSKVPQCIKDCSEAAAKTAGCKDALDTGCVCGDKKDAFTNAATPCILGKCPDLASQALQIQAELCSKGHT